MSSLKVVSIGEWAHLYLISGGRGRTIQEGPFLMNDGGMSRRSTNSGNGIPASSSDCPSQTDSILAAEIALSERKP